jgi:hypothetical protein
MHHLYHPGQLTKIAYFLQSLKLFSENIKCISQFGSGEGEKDVNKKKNRYKDILPCELKLWCSPGEH